MIISLGIYPTSNSLLASWLHLSQSTVRWNYLYNCHAALPVKMDQGSSQVQEEQGVKKNRGLGRNFSTWSGHRQQEGRQGNIMKTGRMAKVRGQGGGWVSQGWLWVCDVLKKQRARGDSSRRAYIEGNYQNSSENDCTKMLTAKCCLLTAHPLFHSINIWWTQTCCK